MSRPCHVSVLYEARSRCFDLVGVVATFLGFSFFVLVFRDLIILAIMTMCCTGWGHRDLCLLGLKRSVKSEHRALRLQHGAATERGSFCHQILCSKWTFSSRSDQKSARRAWPTKCQSLNDPEVVSEVPEWACRHPEQCKVGCASQKNSCKIETDQPSAPD